MDEREIRVRVDGELSPAQPQPIVIVTAPPARTYRRQSAPNWFANSFAATLGIMSAIVLTIGLGAYAAVEYVWYRGASAIQHVQESAAQTNRGVSAAFAPNLRKFGIVKISDDATAFGGRFAGTGLYGSGKIREFTIQYRSAKFNNKTQLEATEIWIDGKQVSP